MTGPTVIIGVGNPERGDDAAGWLVARRLMDGAEVHLSEGDPARLLEIWKGRPDVVLVDATCSDASPGEVVVADLLSGRLPSGALTSTHGMGITEAVELGRWLGALPDRLTFVGIEGESWELGTGPSEGVMRGVEQAVELISSWMDH